MESTKWKLGWRLWSPRSYSEAIDTRTGDRMVMRLSHRGRGVSLDRFGPNAGQPLQTPPVHPLHRDLPELAGGLSLGCWTQDGCYELELKRPEAHLRLILADSRSLACGPSEDPVLRSGVLLCHVNCLRLADNVELSFEPIGADRGVLSLTHLDGPARIQADRLKLAEGTSAFALGRMPGPLETKKALKRIKAMTSYVRYFGHSQLNSPQRMGHAVRWNLCWDAGRRDVFLAVSRSWVQMIAQIVAHPDHRRGPLIFGMDTAIAVLLVARSEPVVGRAIVRAILARQQEDGRQPAFSLGPYDSDRLMPPLLPLAVWYLCHDSGMEFAEEVLPQLAAGHRYLMEHREPFRDGLLCWGDDAAKTSPLRVNGWAGAAYESRMDNSPMWEELGYDEEHRAMGRACVDLCSLAALSARVLAALAERTGTLDPAPFREDYCRIYRAVNDRLYGQDGLYHNLRLDGSQAERVTPTSFYPLAAGLVPKDRARTLIQHHLRNRESFWGHPVIPSLPRNSPFYDGDGDYWRGRIFPPMNYLVWAGLRQTHPAEAAHLAQHSRDLFDEEWEQHGHVHENYSAETSLGEPQPGKYARTCPLYCWGGLLLLPDNEGKIGGAVARLPQIKP